MAKVYTDKDNPEHRLVRIAIRAGLHNIKFTYVPAKICMAANQSGWFMQCDELPYYRFTHRSEDIEKQIKTGTLTDNGTKFKLGNIK